MTDEDELRPPAGRARAGRDLQPADLVNRADNALYQAKDAGRNATSISA